MPLRCTEHTQHGQENGLCADTEHRWRGCCKTESHVLLRTSVYQDFDCRATAFEHGKDFLVRQG